MPAKAILTAYGCLGLLLSALGSILKVQGSPLAPFWLHFGSLWGPFWRLFEVWRLLGSHAPFLIDLGELLGALWVPFELYFGSPEANFSDFFDVTFRTYIFY